MKELNLQRFFAVILLLLLMTGIIALHSHARSIKAPMKAEGKCECVHDTNVEKNVNLSLNECVANYYPEMYMIVNEDKSVRCDCICVRNIV